MHVVSILPKNPLNFSVDNVRVTKILVRWCVHITCVCVGKGTCFIGVWRVEFRSNAWTGF